MATENVTSNPFLFKFQDYLWEIVSWFCLLIFLYYAWQYQVMADGETVPVHFNLKGEPDRFGDASEMNVLTIVSIFIFLLFSALIYFAPKMRVNMPGEITGENLIKARLILRSFMRLMRLVLLTLFSALLYNQFTFLIDGMTEISTMFLIFGFIVLDMILLVTLLVRISSLTSK